MHPYLLHNGQILPTSAKTVSPGQVGFLNGWGVFSTIRVFEGVLFAYERHWARMNRDAQLLRVPMPGDGDELRAELHRLIEANGAYNSTLRVAVVRNRGGMFEGEGITRDFDVTAFTADVHHWGRGVHLGIQPQARHSGSMFAGTKVTSWCFNLTWLEMAKAKGFDEVVLLDDKDRVSECTSANIFMATGGGVVTPPLDSGCLPGVTREIVVKELKVPGVRVVERHITVDELMNAESVFITSTTRELLPVLSLNRQELKQNDTARVALQEAFSKYCDAYNSGAPQAAGAVARQ